MATLVPCNLQLKAEKVISDFYGSLRRLNKMGDKHSYVTDNETWKIKLVPAADAELLAAEAAVLHLIAGKTSVPVARVGEFDCDHEHAWLITSNSPGVNLANLSGLVQDCKELYRQAGRLLAEFHQVSFAARGLVSPNLDIKPAPVWCQEEFKAVINILYNNEIIDEYAVEHWSQLDIDQYFNVGNTLCHGNFSAENIVINHDSIVSVTGLEWACSGPWVADLAAMDVSSKSAGQAHYVDHFYKGYQEIRPVTDFFLAFVEFYRFYHTCLSLAYRQEDPSLLMRLEWYQTAPRFQILKK